MVVLSPKRGRESNSQERWEHDARWVKPVYIYYIDLGQLQLLALLYVERCWNFEMSGSTNNKERIWEAGSVL